MGCPRGPSVLVLLHGFGLQAKRQWWCQVCSRPTLTTKPGSSAPARARRGHIMLLRFPRSRASPAVTAASASLVAPQPPNPYTIVCSPPFSSPRTPGEPSTTAILVCVPTFVGRQRSGSALIRFATRRARRSRRRTSSSPSSKATCPVRVRTVFSPPHQRCVSNERACHQGEARAGGGGDADCVRRRALGGIASSIHVIPDFPKPVCPMMHGAEGPAFCTDTEFEQ
ncbi:hypothetical protein ZEAMMB73_Zm00001d046726 [Zea mays]|uniref:Uncharacterized protein n=1 Tax=Zea mays TaxID=4577 RepID=A0A1D6P4R7_MAIZE|nr:hypothetical protein ZEAMMB73_Zm00001d046726 [Zea mays]